MTNKKKIKEIQMKKVGILGGGQLGRMLLQAAANYPVETFVLENDTECPAAHLCHHFTKGDITNYEDVYNFGKSLDAITIEIESVNIDALKKLESEGVKIYPRPAALEIIKNKITQKNFYKENQIPTSEFVVTHHKSDLTNHLDYLPAAHKVAIGGYDGRGVQILKNEKDFEKAFNEDAVLEKLVNLKKEISLIVAIGEDGKNALYMPVEMVFNNDLNLLEYQLCPANISEKILWKAEAIALTVVKNLQSPGIFAVEMFVDIDDNVLVNETAPRVHNSGHHTIEAAFSSQFDMLWRIILGYPLGNTKPIINSAMVNIIGEENFRGEAKYENLDEVLKIEGTFVHIYGKKETRPGRKMGHVTIVSNERQQLIHIANKVKQLLKVVS
ncbi:MAG: 5-(carboxyamino)imidazole ribonucleotide synthase [Ginsengibacter sp.]